MKCFVLDFASGRACAMDVPANLQDEEYEKLIVEKGFRLSDVEWMVTEDPLLHEV